VIISVRLTEAIFVNEKLRKVIRKIMMQNKVLAPDMISFGEHLS